MKNKFKLWEGNKAFIEDLILFNLCESEEEAINFCISFTIEHTILYNKKTDKQF